MYTALRKALFLVPPETIHTWVFAGLRAATGPAPLRRGLARRLAPHDPVLASTVFGVRFPAPLGLAAGFDKDGLGVHPWGALGFGYAEVGTVTAHLLRGADADEVDRGVVGGDRMVGGEAQSPGVEVAAEDVGEPGFEERDVTGLQAIDLLGVDVDTDDVVPEFGHAGRVRRAEIAATDHRELHGCNDYPGGPAANQPSRCVW